MNLHYPKSLTIILTLSFEDSNFLSSIKGSDKNKNIFLAVNMNLHYPFQSSIKV